MLNNNDKNIEHQMMGLNDTKNPSTQKWCKGSCAVK